MEEAVAEKKEKERPASTTLTPKKVVREMQAAEAAEVLAKLEPALTKLDIYRVRPNDPTRKAFVKRLAWGEVKEQGLQDYLEEHFGGGQFTIRIYQGKDEIGKTELEIEGEIKNLTAKGYPWGQGAEIEKKKKEEEMADMQVMEIYKDSAAKAEEARIKAEDARTRMVEDMLKARSEHDKALTEIRMASDRQIAEIKASQDRQIAEMRTMLERAQEKQKETDTMSRFETLMRSQEERWKTQFDGISKTMEKLADRPVAPPAPSIAEKIIEQVSLRVPELISAFRQGEQTRKSSVEDVVEKIVAATGKQAELSQKQVETLMERLMKVADIDRKAPDSTKAITELLGAVVNIGKDFAKMYSEGSRPVDMGGLDLAPRASGAGGFWDNFSPVLERVAGAVIKTLSQPSAPTAPMPIVMPENHRSAAAVSTPVEQEMTPDRRSVEVLRSMLAARSAPDDVAEAVFNAIEGARYYGLQSGMVEMLMADPAMAFDRYVLPLPELEGAEGREYGARVKDAIVSRVTEAVAPLRA